MDIEKLIEAVKLCGSTPKVDQCKKCTYWAGGDMSKCIPRMTEDAATALSTLQTENEKLRAELERCKEKNAGLALALLTECAPNPDCLGNDEWRAIRSELEQVKRTLAMMWFAYVNSDKEAPHSYETEVLEEAERLLGPWKECMPKYFGRAALSNAVKSENEFVEYGSEEE